MLNTHWSTLDAHWSPSHGSTHPPLDAQHSPLDAQHSLVNAQHSLVDAQCVSCSMLSAHWSTRDAHCVFSTWRARMNTAAENGLPNLSKWYAMSRSPYPSAMPTNTLSYGVTAGQFACEPSVAMVVAASALISPALPTCAGLVALTAFLLYNTVVSPGWPSTSSDIDISMPISSFSAARRRSCVTHGAPAGCSPGSTHPAHSWHMTTLRSPASSARSSPAHCVARSRGSVMTARRLALTSPDVHAPGCAATHASSARRLLTIFAPTTELFSSGSICACRTRCDSHPGYFSSHRSLRFMTTPVTPRRAPPCG
mmetsp:Transcript_782/g.1821  ORF Transcript_782/g.1821 Transcript_782/m.1821 type:complete len:311 (-) Transcript_782:526-1458(-)